MTGSQHTLLADLGRRMPRGGPNWLGGMRDHAVSVLDASGLPTTKHEAWRFTSLRGVVDREYASPSPPDSLAWVDEALGKLGDDGAWRVVLVNGMPYSRNGYSENGYPENQYLDRTTLPRGINVHIINTNTGTDANTDAGVAMAPPFASYLGKLARVEHFSALNMALFERVLAIEVQAGVTVDRPLHVVYAGVPAEKPTVVYPRVLVVAGPGSQCTLMESYLTREGSAHLTSSVTEIAIGDNARVTHVRAHHGTSNGRVVGTVAVRQARDSTYRSHVVSLGGALCRLDLDVELGDEGAECVLEGAYHVGRGEHVDHHTSIDHKAPRCRSHEDYRGILDGSGHAVFDGTIIVRPDAQQSDAHQENRNLLLSDDAVINTKPHLRIDADDVKCSHGATIGSLDADQLFYLRARGIAEKSARAMLTYGFVRQILDRIEHAPMARRLAELVKARLPHGHEVDDEIPEELPEDMPASQDAATLQEEPA